MASRTEVETLIDTNLPSDPPPNNKIRSQKHREVEKKIVEYATNTIKLSSVLAGDSVTDTRMVGRLVGEIIINSNSKTEGFTKLVNSDTLILDDGSLFSNNDTVIIKML